MPDKRRQYRVPLATEEDFRVLVRRPGKKAVNGEICDLAIQGLGIRFDHRSEAVFAIRDVVNLELSSAKLDRPILAPAMVRHRREDDRGRIYGFQFLDWLGLLSRLPLSLACLFNQRGSHRVQPQPTEHVDVTIEGSLLPSSVRAELYDISATGLSVQAPFAIENMLMKVERVKLSFLLPGSQAKLVFWGNIMHREIAFDRIRYGIVFSVKKTTDFKKMQAAVQKYVTEREHALLPLVASSEA